MARCRKLLECGVISKVSTRRSIGKGGMEIQHRNKIRIKLRGVVCDVSIGRFLLPCLPAIIPCNNTVCLRRGNIPLLWFRIKSGDVADACRRGNGRDISKKKTGCDEKHSECRNKDKGDRQRLSFLFTTLKILPSHVEEHET